MGEARRRYSYRDGVARSTFYDEGKLHVMVSQDVEPILDGIARDRETMRHGPDRKLEGRLPLIVVEDLIRRGLYFDLDAFNRWWRTSEADPWRIWKGRG